jgi:hypothetical protein
MTQIIGEAHDQTASCTKQICLLQNLKEVHKTMPGKLVVGVVGDLRREGKS